MKQTTRTLILCFLPFFLTACALPAVTDIESIITETQLKSDVTLPVDLNVAYYVADEELQRVHLETHGERQRFWHVGPQFKKALDLVFPSYFKTANQLTPKSTFDLMIKMKSEQSFDLFMGTCWVHLDVEIIDGQGNTIFTKKVKASTRSTRVDDVTCFLNSYAKTIEEALIQFLNTVDFESAKSTGTSIPFYKTDNYQKYFKDEKPTSSGTGFYINETGEVLTASHVINGCFMIEVKKGENKVKSSVLKNSRILDLAILETNQSTKSYLSISESALAANNLGQNVKAVGYPLSGILSDNPSLTVGNISSVGGLKGDKTNFQFTAPIQPGNSGGPVLNDSGQVLGVVSSTLNQAMMLRSSGAISQNVNFAVKTDYMKRFLDGVSYGTGKEHNNTDVINNTVQVLCYK